MQGDTVTGASAIRALLDELGAAPVKARGVAAQIPGCFQGDVIQVLRALGYTQRRTHDGSSWYRPAAVPESRRPDALPTYAKAPLSRRPITSVILSDTHVPEIDEAFWSLAKQLLVHLDPDRVILLGDIGELASVSSHESAGEGAILEDFRQLRLWLKELRGCISPDADIDYLEGNHETRMQRWIKQNAPQISGLVSVEEGLGLRGLDIRWIPEKAQPVVYGSLLAIHGHQIFQGSAAPKYFPSKVLDRYAAAGRTIIHGHLHRHAILSVPTWTEDRTSGATGQAYAVGMGCGRTLGPAWQHGSVDGWCHQLAVAYERDDGLTDLQVITIRRGRMVFDGREFRA